MCLGTRTGVTEMLVYGVGLPAAVALAFSITFPSLYAGTAMLGVAPPGRDALARALESAANGSRAMLGLLPASLFLAVALPLDLILPFLSFFVALSAAVAAHDFVTSFPRDDEHVDAFWNRRKAEAACIALVAVQGALTVIFATEIIRSTGELL